jgi:hypothetical protein
MKHEPKPIGGGVCELLLSNGMVTLLSEGDAETVSNFRWHASTDKASHTWYARARVVDSRVASGMHRVLLCFPLLFVDHINRNGLDNRRENLRLCTHEQNNCNKPNRPNKTSRFRGVFYQGKRWVVQVRDKQKLYRLGSFSDEVEAALVYDQFVASVRGEFAILNFPDEVSTQRH